jgi:pimeloyl-ACP methyl ester carboxylesterase
MFMPLASALNRPQKRLMSKYALSADGMRIAYDILGEGPPVLLIHGFGANRRITWENTGWYDALVRAGHKVLAVDCRGHGESEKPHDPAAYDEGSMAADALAVLDAEGIETADVMGYSMGGYLTLRLAHDAPHRVGRAVLGGVGATYFGYWKGRDERVAAALLAPDAGAITDPLGLEFRRFAEAAKGDLTALAACMRRPRRIFTRDELHRLTQEFLIVCGEADDVSGSAQGLAIYFAHAEAVSVPGRDHHRTVGDTRYKQAVTEFLARR